jgi:hypothetical protein
MDRHFIISGLESSFPILLKVLRCLPISSLKRFLGSRDRIVQVSFSILVPACRCLLSETEVRQTVIREIY